VYGIYNLEKALIANSKAAMEIDKVEKATPAEYLSLFRTEYLNSIDTGLTYLSRVRTPVSNITLDKKYSVWIFKLNIDSQHSPLRSIITVLFKSSNPMVKTPYNFLKTDIFRLYYLAGKQMISDSIYFQLKADSVNGTAINDSVFEIYAVCRNFSLRYRKEGTSDVIGYNEGLYISRKFPANFLFLRKQHALYFLIMSSNRDKEFSTTRLSKIVKY